MISIRYTAPRDLELSGSRDALDLVRSAVNDIRTLGSGTVRFPTEAAGNPSPHAGTLDMLRIRVDDDKLHVLVLGQHLVITGNPDALHLFCVALEVAAAGPPGSHSHLEYHDGHPQIAPRSLPIVVTREA